MSRLKSNMVSFIAALLVVAVLFSCGEGSGKEQQLQAQVDSLQQKITNAYKPGLGEFMLGMQLHHAKLWFAGKNRNWPLADFEVGEIKEALDDIQEYETDRVEVKSLPMILPAVDSIANAVKQKDSSL